MQNRLHFKALIGVLWLASPFGVAAEQACPVVAQDLTPMLQASFPTAQITVTHGKDIDSEEPIRRTLVGLANSNVLLVEQRHCKIYNLTVTLLDAARLTNDETMALLLKPVAVAPTWTQHFGDAPKDAFKNTAVVQGTTGLDDTVRSVNGDAEILLQHDVGGMSESGFDRVTTLYIGVDGP